MGSVYNDTTFPGDLSINDLKQAFRAFHASQRIHYGNNPYSGSFASNLNGLTIDVDATFTDRQQAIDYINARTDKFSPALVVRLHEPDKAPVWYVGAYCRD